MDSTPFQYPSAKIGPRRPALDIRSGKRSVRPAAPMLAKRPVTEARPPRISEIRTLDGVAREQRSLVESLREATVQDALWRAFRRGQLYFRRFRRIAVRFIPNLTPQKMVYGTLFGGVAFGMLSMAALTHFLGPDVSAEGTLPVPGTSVTAYADASAGVSPDSDVFFDYFGISGSETEYEAHVREMVAGYPIEDMLPYIFEQDRMVAAFLIGIAKKESNWGKRVPVLEGQDCFNYWGYRGQRRMMGTGGHTCFNSRQDAVETVAKRLETLIHSEELNTPEKLVVWKCGFSCEGHSQESVRKWISDVDRYYSQAMEAAEAEEGR